MNCEWYNWVDLKCLWLWIITGWWFGTFFIFPYIGNNHPNWLIFFRGVETTNQLWIILWDPSFTQSVDRCMILHMIPLFIAFDKGSEKICRNHIWFSTFSRWGKFNCNFPMNQSNDSWVSIHQTWLGNPETEAKKSTMWKSDAKNHGLDCGNPCSVAGGYLVVNYPWIVFVCYNPGDFNGIFTLVKNGISGGNVHLNN